MLRFVKVILWNLPRAYMIPRMAYRARHGEKYSEQVCAACDPPHDAGGTYLDTEIRHGASARGGRLYDVSEPSGQV